jgi:hypothetical protein
VISPMWWVQIPPGPTIRFRTYWYGTMQNYLAPFEESNFGSWEVVTFVEV